jgi:hypothetical protein
VWLAVEVGARDRTELSTLRFSARTKEATRGSGTPLPLILLVFPQTPDHLKPPRAATDCQSFVSQTVASITSAWLRFAIETWPSNSRFNRRGRHSSSRTCTIEERFLGLFQCGDRLLLGNSWEIFEELGERLSGLEIVDQGVERHTCAHEHGCPAHDLRIAMDDRLLVHDEAIVAVEEGQPFDRLSVICQSTARR